jgi:hypothetical protein
MEEFIYKGKSFPVKAQVVGERLMSIYKRENKQLTPEMVLEDAERKNSPLHICFEWDDSEAAHKYRLSQAGDIIRSVSVKYKTNEDKDVCVRSFVSIRVDENNVLTDNFFQKNASSFYVSIKDAMTDDILKKYTLDMALKELRSFMEKYRSINELDGLFSYVNEKFKF